MDRPFVPGSAYRGPYNAWEIELAKAIFETALRQTRLRQNQSFNWNQRRNQRHVNLVKEGPD